jgi:TPR repeat protein
MKTFLIFWLTMSYVVFALAGPQQDAQLARDRGYYSEEVAIAKKYAPQGAIWAQTILGNSYRSGQGVEKNDIESTKWFRLAADQGDPDAMVNLGFHYFVGKGVTKDFKEALKLFRRAAETGNPNALHNLGLMYEKGQGVEKNITLAYMWYIASASNGSGIGFEKELAMQKHLTPAQADTAKKKATMCIHRNYINCEN